MTRLSRRWRASLPDGHLRNFSAASSRSGIRRLWHPRTLALATRLRTGEWRAGEDHGHIPRSRCEVSGGCDPWAASGRRVDGRGMQRVGGFPPDPRFRERVLGIPISLNRHAFYTSKQDSIKSPCANVQCVSCKGKGAFMSARNARHQPGCRARELAQREQRVRCSRSAACRERGTRHLRG
jgi:hypothetical protein